MLIAIPSMGRADRQRTFFALKEAGVDAMLVVPHDEVKAYKEFPRIGLKVKGIGPTRQAMLRMGDNKVLMLDDDLEFFARRKDDPTKLRAATPAQVRAMLSLASKLLDKHAHVGVATREGANRNTAPIIYNTRLLRVLGYRADVLTREGIRFDRIPVMEDFDVALQLLRKGYSSAQINSFTQDQPGSNTVGGCSAYRTAEVQAQGAHGLWMNHPEFVRIVHKPPLKSGGWNGEPRTDVRIAWKKARESAGREVNV